MKTINFKRSVSDIYISFILILFTVTVLQLDAQPIAVRDGGHLARIDSNAAIYLGTTITPGLGHWMYAGGSPMDGSGSIFLIKRFGQVIKRTNSGAQSVLTNLSSFYSPFWNTPMVLRSDGSLMALNHYGKLVEIDGTTATEIVDLSIYATEWSRISLDHQDNVLAISFSGKVVQIEPDGSHSLLSDVSAFGSAWWKAILGSDGNYYFLNDDGKIYRLDDCGLQLFVDFGQFNTDNLWQNFANHPNGNIYGLNYYDGQVAEMDLSDGSTSIIASFDNAPPAAWYGPVIDNSGTIFVWQNSGIFKRVYANGNVESLSSDLNSIAYAGWYSIAAEEHLVQPNIPALCCPDSDGDTICNNEDNCPNTANTGQADADCDGVGDVCDVCAGANDSIDNNEDGLPDCAFPPDLEDIIAAWKCGNKNQKIAVCHGSGANAETKCISYNAIQSHVNHGDYIGPCGSVDCNEVLKGGKEIDVLSKNQTPELQIFPNPANQQLNITLSNVSTQFVQVNIQDELGRVVWNDKMKLNGNRLRIDLPTHFTNGIYFLTIETDNEKISQRFIIVK